MKLPVIGNIVIYNEMTIFAKTFASLLKNNVDITQSIDILSKITDNEVYKNIMVRTIDNITKGDKISEAFKNQWAVPDVAYYMIVTGESTGQLAEMMSMVSSYYQEQHHNLIANLKSFIEPVMIVLLAVVVGGIILAVIIPMFNMYEQISMGS
jgi:type IV pilus assembly protein PilC